MKRKKIGGRLFRALPKPENQGKDLWEILWEMKKKWYKPDYVVGTPYILGDDGNFYSVFAREFSSFTIKYEEEENFDGVDVVFETPVIACGKKRWAYNLKLQKRRKK